jgi:hypothetical protein
MDPDAIRAASVLEARGLARFAAQGNIITDDNQLLSYSWSIDPVLEKFQQKAADNLAEIRRLAEQ